MSFSYLQTLNGFFSTSETQASQGAITLMGQQGAHLHSLGFENVDCSEMLVGLILSV